MHKDERDLLDVLKFELEFVEKGGYNPSPRDPRKTSLFFEDSPTCMNYDSKDSPGPCNDCVLMGLVPPEQRNQTIPCRHIPLDAAGHTLDSLYRQAEVGEISEIYENWLRGAIQKLTEDREKRARGAGRAPATTAAPAESATPALGQPLFGKLHPKCANPSCASAFHWLAGGRFFRFRAGDFAGATKDQAAACADPAAAVKHYWLCESCGDAYTLSYIPDLGVVVESRWSELPTSEPLKQISAARG